MKHAARTAMVAIATPFLWIVIAMAWIIVLVVIGYSAVTGVKVWRFYSTDPDPPGKESDPPGRSSRSPRLILSYGRA